MKPYYDHAGIQIWCQDCREWFKNHPDIKVDAVLSDPPYGISHKSSHGASWEGVEIAGDADSSIRDFVWEIFSHLPRAMFGISWRVRPPKDVRAVIIWDKEHIGCGDLNVPWKPSWEEIYIIGDGWFGTRENGVLRGKCVHTHETGPGNNGLNGRKHPHEKPVWLMAKLMSKLPESYLVLDPFMGSGTTLVAAKLLGRRAIGIEIEEKYCEIATRRLAQEVMTL